MLQTRLNQTYEVRYQKQQLESERSKVYILQNFTEQMDKKLMDFKIDILQTSINQTNVKLHYRQQI